MSQYVNDMDYNVYADDTVIYWANKNEATANANVENDLNILTQWCERNQLTVNIKKTKPVLFGTKEMLRNSLHIDMYMGTDKFQYLNHLMYLGIKLDKKVRFELPANECCRHVIHKNYIQSKIRRYIITHQTITIYKCMVLPYFCYGDIYAQPQSGDI